MKKILLIIIFFLAFKTADAQRRPFPPNESPPVFSDSDNSSLLKGATVNAYGELFGNGFLMSFNGEYLYSNVGVRAGIGLYFIVPNIPLMLVLNTGKTEHKFETSIGAVLAPNVVIRDVFRTQTTQSYAWTAAIGYRYQPRKEGFMFRLTFTPFFTDNIFRFSGGISVGHSTTYNN
ncbi:MAG TPA: hypothetical protein VEC36_02985 [Patescibacteria group bacterium]|nr:hypothetical protein [Patescibacteria group bacterium]